MTIRRERRDLFHAYCALCFSTVSSRRSSSIRSVTELTSSWISMNHTAACLIQPYIDQGTGRVELTLSLRGTGDGGDHVVILLHAVDYRERDVSADCRAQAGRQ
jgi:hypothetical protein